ncbi:hypothetical protein Vspart_03092 [Vibrio spartinae]|uniref:Uncharacterized protein n=1 Tax=Vibrio spartinae TaxID=1918945 RepID=A0ABX6R2L9_9VIBR|nr:hypothetical protein Vspart_03092 [Vibrio spartinae]
MILPINSIHITLQVINHTILFCCLCTALSTPELVHQHGRPKNGNDGTAPSKSVRTLFGIEP